MSAATTFGSRKAKGHTRRGIGKKESVPDMDFDSLTGAKVAEQPDTLHAKIPKAMQQARRWLLWKPEPSDKPDGKPRKVPYYVDGQRRQGKLDTEADQARLVTMDEAIRAAKGLKGSSLGFALGPDADGNYWQGVDLDGCDQHPELEELAKRLPGYVERSPSGKGYHAIGIGEAFKGLGSNTSGIEAYC